MKLLKSEQPQCLLYSAAMILDIDPRRLVQLIGHDGLDVVRKAPKPTCYRGIAIQEIIDVFYCIGKAIMTIVPRPALGRTENHAVLVYSYDESQKRMSSYLDKHDAILVSNTHAVAWCHIAEKIYDPKGQILEIHEFDYQIAYVVVPMRK